MQGSKLVFARWQNVHNLWTFEFLINLAIACVRLRSKEAVEQGEGEQDSAPVQASVVEGLL